MGKYFGTDGIRGVANRGLDSELAFKTGAALAVVLKESEGKKPLVTIGKDTRISSDMLEAALTAGLCSMGADVMPLGVLPTPAVAYLTVRHRASAGIVISASHNPYEHNGIKVFSGAGYKLSDALENRIEEMIDNGYGQSCSHNELGRVLREDGVNLSMYIEHLVSCAENEIRGLRIAVDCANGAASATAAKLFSRFDIDFELIHDHPNGVNINDGCGSTHMERLQNLVRAGKYDCGIAFDGDADRCLVVDEKGEVVDGDKIMGMVGRAMMAKGKLRHNTIVATVMSNLGFHEYAGKTGIQLKCAAVGDRNVLEMMQAGGYNLGGEQSGHLIFLDDATTGDGQLAAVKFLSLLSGSGKTVSEMVSMIPRYPQVLLNLPISGGNEAKNAIMASDTLKQAVAGEEAAMDGTGRILVRPSGTEALIRVMVEARDEETAQDTAGRLVELIKNL